MNKKISKILFIMFAIIMICTNSYADWFIAPEVYEKEKFLTKIFILILIIIIMLIIRLFIKQSDKAIKENSESKDIVKTYVIAIVSLYLSFIMFLLISHLDLYVPYSASILSVIFFIISKVVLIVNIVVVVFFPIIMFIKIRKDKENDLWNYIKYWSMISFLFLFQIYLSLEFEIKSLIVLILALMYLFFYIKLKPKMTKEIDEYKKYIKFKIFSTLFCLLVVVRYTLFESLFGTLFGSFNLAIVVIVLIIVGIIYVLLCE